MDNRPLFRPLVEHYVTTKRYHDARYFIDFDGSLLSDEQRESLREEFGVTDADLRTMTEDAIRRHGVRADWLRRAYAKRQKLRGLGTEPTMKQVANALVAEKDWHAAQWDVLKEVFETA